MASPVLHVWVYEGAPELLARHMLLLSILLDTALPLRQRAETFIELHGNACLQTATAAYLGGSPDVSALPTCYRLLTKTWFCAEKQSQLLETLTLNSSAGQQADNLLTELFDLSALRFQQRDDIAEAFRRYSSKVGGCCLLCCAVLCCAVLCCAVLCCPTFSLVACI